MFNTPDDIMNYTDEQVLNMIEDTDSNLICDKYQRYELIKLFYKALGFELTPDALLFLLDESKVLAVVATAGSGKTTITQVKIILEKLIRKSGIRDGMIVGRRVACVVYNKHNVSQMETAHRNLIRKIKGSGVKGLNIDEDINAFTMHSFCLMWLEEFSRYTDMHIRSLINDNERTMMFNRYLVNISKRDKVDTHGVKVQELIKLYDVCRETLTEYDDVDSLLQFPEARLDKKYVIDSFRMIDKFKDTRNSYDFTDVLLDMKKLLLEHEDARQKIQTYYDYITVDEFQDLTPVMMDIVSLIRHDSAPVVCIGDEDQSIYSFKGVDIGNSLDFDKRFEGGKILSLLVNRRCRHNIIEAAKTVIEHNTLRFNKQLVGTKEGGVLELLPYNTQEGQMINLIKRLDNLSYEEKENTVICYRNKKSSMILSEYLEDKKIQFNVISGYMPFSHELYGHVIDVLSMLIRCYDYDKFLALYKCLPINKKDVYKILGYDARTRKFTNPPQGKHFLELDFGEYMSRPKFVQALKELSTFVKPAQDKPLQDYFPRLFLMIKKYFWDFKSELNDEEEFDEYYESKVLKFFNSHLVYEKLESSYYIRKQECKINNMNRVGVTLSTFHKLKGLEYSRVFIIDFDDSIFPNFASRDELPNLSERAKLDLKEVETRLCYVALTRAKDELYIYYNQQNPSIYVDWLKNKTAKPVRSKMQIVGDMLETNTGSTPSVNANSNKAGMLDELLHSGKTEDKPEMTRFSLNLDELADEKVPIVNLDNLEEVDIKENNTSIHINLEELEELDVDKIDKDIERVDDSKQTEDVQPTPLMTKYSDIKVSEETKQVIEEAVENQEQEKPNDEKVGIDYLGFVLDML